ncbi:DUF3219 family protein [Alkalihalobacterium bogoriense]|uniref:DUF3219 family protein n=1 Tax=Alkalihalobacterium bogoriense TaxID=246272 RepID=UPI0006874B66|nr:DUF3219 family protein [Alkalihalobacterium bogoriense]
MLVQQIKLNEKVINATQYNYEKKDNRITISFGFDVKSEDYHDVTTLLYEQTFDVYLIEENISFRGSIIQYSTSLTNLYKSGEIGKFTLCLQEAPTEEAEDKL